ncbi:helix-turn-helix domain-containing protein [Amnibacterium kyonggiense]|uniref:AraC family transcriptional regulator n=1 Tax=Amnibacterium kyonggiense TaxID=595671 RepID=A0A4R7FIR7_9MICO|nr:helix-turn-helix domain-containing protein [Amnibacterium kyonggiense]TDS74484.1 AraC family transcriptional regulator [Amnibacterium kyonggiense]
MGTRTGLWQQTDFGTRVRPAREPVEGYRTFSTRGLGVDERVDLWERHNATALIDLRARTIDESVLEAREVVLRVGDLQLADVVANPHVVERSSAQIARSRVDGVALYFSLFGESFFYHDGGVHTQRPGTVLLCDVSRPFMRGFANGLEELVVRIPRQVYERIAGGALPRSPVVMRFDDAPDGNEYAGALARLVRGTLERPSADALAVAERSALGLVEAMLTGEAPSTAHRRAALDHIDRHLADRSLSVRTVARAVGVSERHLARVFAENGPGVARTILERRLDLAHRLLCSSSRPAVSAVAERCGFASAAHFARVFRERFDRTPAEVRASASG